MGLEICWLELAENKLEDIFGYYLVKANKKVAGRLVNGIVDTTIGKDKRRNLPDCHQLVATKQKRF